MSIDKKVSITLSIPKAYRDNLRMMAAKQNLHDPDKRTSASTIAREIICEYIDHIESIEVDFKAAANAPNLNVESDHLDSHGAVGEK
jgi:hypothetical protein